MLSARRLAPSRLALAAGLVPGAFVFLISLMGADDRARLALIPLWALCGAAAGLCSGSMIRVDMTSSV